MRSDYLVKTGSVVLDASGAGSVTIKPDVGQYWTPKFVRVSTNSQATPLPYCAVYQGPTTIASQTTFIDDTNFGNGDTSSIIAGTVVMYGEAVTARWTGGNPGDIAVLSIYGSTQDTPPSVSDMPTTPGTHFSGKPSPEVINLVSQNTGTVMLTNSQITIGPFDARAYSSYMMDVDATASGVPLQYDPIVVEFRWTSRSVIGANIIYRDAAAFFARCLAGTFQFQGDTMFMQDVCHGPYFYVNISNISPNSVTVAWDLFVSTRQLPGPYFRQPNEDIVDSDDGNLLFITPGTAIGAGATLHFAMPFTYGRVACDFFSGGPIMNFNLRQAGFANTWKQYSITGTTVRPEIAAPKRAMWLEVVNGGGASTFGATLVTQFDKV